LVVLEFAHAEGVHDVPHSADQRERANPGDEKDRAATVVTCCPESERDQNDPADELQPPDIDLVPGGDRHDDVEDPGEEQEEAEDGGEGQERVTRVDERDDAGREERESEYPVEQLPPAWRDEDR